MWLLELALVALAAVALAVGVSWPLLARAAIEYPSNPLMPDLNVGIWFPAHFAANLGLPDLLSAPELHWPLGQDNGNIVWNAGIQVLQLPFFLAWEPVPAYNLSLLAMAALNGLGAWIFARTLGAGRAGAFAAMALLVASPYAWSELMEGRCEQGLLAFTLLTVAGFWRLGRQPSWRVALVTGVSWALTGFCYWFYAYFLGLVLVPLGLVLAIRRRWWALGSLALAGAVAGLLVAPVAGRLLLEAGVEGSVYQTSSGSDFITVAGSQGWTSLQLTSLSWPLAVPSLLRDVVPLTLSLPLLLGLVLRRRSSWLPWLGVAGLVLAMGGLLHVDRSHPLLVGGHTISLPFAVLQTALPGFWRLCWPYRFLSLAVIGGAGCAALVVGALPRWRWSASALLAVLAVGELRLGQVRTSSPTLWNSDLPLEVPALFRELATEPGQHPLLVLPFHGHVSSVRWVYYHQQPVTEGNGDAEPFLRSREHQAWVAAQPVMAELDALAADPEHTLDTGMQPLDELAALGLHWAVLQLVFEQQEIERYRAWFGRPPDYQDDSIAAWRTGSPPDER